MGGALLVALPAYQVGTKALWPKPLLAAEYILPTSKALDWKLIVGSAVFGVGWGLAGLCPGPAIVGLATLRPVYIAFAAALAVGMAGEKLAARAFA